jgi:photosystem II stability/assembly factor-like uncharacterized protein
MEIAAPDGSPVCFSARSGGLFVSRDFGKTWQYAYQTLLGDTPLATLALAKAELSDLSQLLLAGVSGAVLRSEDGGHSWQISRLPEPGGVVTALAVSPEFSADGTALAATGEDGILVSNNWGKSWTAWNFGLIDFNVLAVVVSPAFSHDQRVFAGVSSGLFQSVNRGRSWQPIELPCGYDAVLSLTFSPDFEKDGVGYAGTEEHGVLRTLDGGQTWQAAGSGLDEGAVNGLALVPGYQGNFVVAALVGSRLFFSWDQGSTWEPWEIKGLPAGFDITVFTAPDGIGPGKPGWLGSADGRVLYSKT